jgi:hypothetical protein
MGNTPSSINNDEERPRPRHLRPEDLQSPPNHDKSIYQSGSATVYNITLAELEQIQEQKNQAAQNRRKPSSQVTSIDIEKFIKQRDIQLPKQ